MSDNDTLLAYLVPKLTSGVEDAATDALAYILNKSKQCREALVAMVSDSDFKLEPLIHAQTQVAPSKTARLDLVGYDSVGYDSADTRRLIIESKFWAALGDGQASGYVGYLAPEQPAVLLFVAPEVRRETLWAKIEKEFSQAHDLQLGDLRQDDRLRAADVVSTSCVDAKWRVALTSWHALLNHLELADASMASDVRQLKNLANAQDDRAFAPLHLDDFKPAIPRRHLDFCRIVNDVVDTGQHQGWLSVQGLNAAAQWDGYLRYFQFCAQDGNSMSSAIALYFSADRWVRSGTRPIWLRCWHKPEQIALAQQTEIEFEQDPGGPAWVPLRLLTGAEYPDVLADVVTQLKRVRDIVLP